MSNPEQTFDIENRYVAAILDRFPVLLQLEYIPYSDQPPTSLQARLNHLATHYPDRLRPLMQGDAWEALLAVCDLSDIPLPTKPLLAPDEYGIWDISDCGGYVRRRLSEKDDEGDTRSLSDWLKVQSKIPPKIVQFIKEKLKEHEQV